MKKVMMAKSTTPVCCVISPFDWCISVSSSRCSSVGYIAPVGALGNVKFLYECLNLHFLQCND